MTSPIQLAGAQCMTSTVIALHCSLGSGRQWAHLAETLGQSHRILAPDIAGSETAEWSSGSPHNIQHAATPSWRFKNLIARRARLRS